VLAVGDCGLGAGGVGNGGPATHRRARHDAGRPQRLVVATREKLDLHALDLEDSLADKTTTTEFVGRCTLSSSPSTSRPGDGVLGHQLGGANLRPELQKGRSRRRKARRRPL